jgi:hypothetical protein
MLSMSLLVRETMFCLGFEEEKIAWVEEGCLRRVFLVFWRRRRSRRASSHEFVIHEPVICNTSIYIVTKLGIERFLVHNISLRHSFIHRF